MAWITAFIIALSILAGHLIAEKSKKIDSPIEEAIEYMLKQKGIDIDFSANKKQQYCKKQENNKDNKNTGDKKK